MIKHTPILVDAIKAYYKDEEIFEICDICDVAYDFYETDISRLRFARKLLAEIEHNNHRRFLETLVPSLISRAMEGVANNKYEKQEFHIRMVGNLEELSSSLSAGGLPEEVSVSEKKPFTAKSAIRELISSAETEVTVVDNYIGLGTLDCLHDVKHPIRLLTGQHGSALESGFDRGLKDFISEGHKIEVRRHLKLHDRYILFNDRCWIVGSSLKDAGKKILNIIEFVDFKNSISADIEKKWGEATKHTI